jgi:undecaprenol kinase/diacylglycerol kinase (ATP)
VSSKHPILKSFPYAFDGIKTAIKNEPNFRFHLVAGVIAISMGVYFKLTALEFAVLMIAIGFVVIIELINTMLEALVDLVSPEIAQQAKIAKDVSAAAVLASAVLSVVIGILLFLPKIFS